MAHVGRPCQQRARGAMASSGGPEEGESIKATELPAYMRPPKDITSSNILYIAGVGDALGSSRGDVEALLAGSGLDAASDAICMVPARGYIFARFSDEASADAAKERLTGQMVQGRRLFVQYAVPYQDKPSPTDPECPSTSAQVVIPGLVLIEDFISEEEEAALLHVADGDHGTHWQDVISRRVQHYGFTFDYDTRHVDYATEVPPLPEVCGPLLSRALASLPKDLVPAAPDQLTINEYTPGQGISPHVETHSAFKDGLLSLSLGSACVMDFRRADMPDRRKALLLPPRSLLVLSGEARYAWSHGIAWRTWDKVDGVRVPRARRVSFTFRRVLRSAVCFCAYPQLCDSTLEDRQARRALLRDAQADPECVRPSDVEKDHVHAIYETIAPHWNHTRAIRRVHWPRVKEFLASIPPYSLIADVGCGDGKYLDMREMGNPTCVALGCDRSLKLLQLSNQGHDYELMACDVLTLPYRSLLFDAALCTAVLHHMSTPKHRVQALRELSRILRVGGLLDIQVWALEQEHGSRRRFEDQDVLVPWKMQAKYADPSYTERLQAAATDQELPAPPTHGAAESGQAGLPDYDPVAKLITYKRYCHMYKEWELEGLIDSLAPDIQFEVIDRGYDKGNWFVRLRKTVDEVNTV